MVGSSNQAKDDDHEELLKWIERKEFNRSEKIEAVTQIYNKLHLRQLTESKMKEYYEKALDALRKINRSESEKECFYQLANNLMYRIS